MLTPWIVPSFVVALLWQFMWQSDVGIVNKILVDYTGLLSTRPVWLTRRGLAVGDHHPLDLARAAVRDADLLRGAAGDPARARRGGRDRRRRAVAALPPHHAAAAAAADRHPAAVRRHLRRLPVRDPGRDARLDAGAGRRPDDDPDRPPVVPEQPVRVRGGGVGAADAGDVRVGVRVVADRSAATWRRRHDRARDVPAHAQARERARARRAHVARAARDARAGAVADRSPRRRRSCTWRPARSTSCTRR